MAGADEFLPWNLCEGFQQGRRADLGIATDLFRVSLSNIRGNHTMSLT
jgi:hypothetical protein